jgi:hypothetical protein
LKPGNTSPETYIRKQDFAVFSLQDASERSHGKHCVDLKDNLKIRVG